MNVYVSLSVGCALYVVRAASHISASVCVLPFCLDTQLLRGMLPYPAWIYFSALGGEDVFVRVGVKSEFIARWLPPRMRTAVMMGRREDPPSQWGGGMLFCSEKEERIPA